MKQSICPVKFMLSEPAFLCQDIFLTVVFFPYTLGYLSINRIQATSLARRSRMSAQVMSLRKMEQLGISQQNHGQFSLGSCIPVYFNDFSQDILFILTQRLKILEINRGFNVSQSCFAEIIGWGFSVSKWRSKNPLLPLFSTPALPFGICPPWLF